MDLDIFDVIEEATRENNSFENHPLRTYSVEEQLLYLQGLALVMNADNEIHDDEKEYLRILIKSFDMDQSSLDALVQFAQSPDKDTVQAFFKTFRRKPIAQLFLFDALMMTRRDNKVDDKEKAVVDKIAEQLEILKGTQQDIYDLFCHIKNKDWHESALYFSSHLLNPDHFKHLLDYFEVDFDELLARTASIRASRLGEVMASKLNMENWEWIPLQYGNDDQMPNATEITANCINLYDVTANGELVLPYLQSKLDRGELRVSAELKVFLSAAEGEQEIATTQALGVNYCPESRSFTLNLAQDEATRKMQLGHIFCLLGCSQIQPETCEQFNQVLRLITGQSNAQLATTKRFSSSDSDYRFPQTNDEQYLTNEVLCSYEDRNRLILSNGSSYTGSPNRSEHTFTSLLFSGEFRIMR